MPAPWYEGLLLHRSFLLLPVLFVLASHGEAQASGPVGKTGDPLQTSDYNIDLHRGPVLASSRVVGLAGAYEAIAEGVSGFAFNPAAVATRRPWSTSWFDWEMGAGFTLPANLSDYDFDNNGDESFNSNAAFFGSGGLGLQFGHFGIGMQINLELYQVESAKQDDILNLTAVDVALLTGYGFLDGQLVLGASIALHDVGIDRATVIGGDNNKASSIAASRGVALGVGLLWAPPYAPLRIGVSTRLSPPASWQDETKPVCKPPRCEQVGEDFIADGTYYLPRALSLPTEIRAGIAVQLLRRMNLPWVDPRDEAINEERRAKSIIAYARNARRDLHRHRKASAKKRGRSSALVDKEFSKREGPQRNAEEELISEARAKDRKRRLAPYKRFRREKVLLTTGVKITLPAENAIGLDSFLTQTVERSGEYVTAQPHAAVEAEVWPRYLVARLGSYVEPSRFAKGLERVHFTTGFDVHIPLTWDVAGLFEEAQSFRVGGAFDYTARYVGWGLSAGVWR